MRISSLVVTKLAAAALVLTALVFAPISSQAEEVIFEGNTATAIKDLECGEDVFYDVTFVFDVGTAAYGPHPGKFPYDGANDEVATFALGDCIQNALNACPEAAITRVGPQNRSYFFIAFGAETEEPGTETPWFYGAFESRYYDTVNEEIDRPAETWVPADNFMITIDFLPDDEEFNFVDITWEGFPFGVQVLPDDVPYSWAKIEPAADSPDPPDVYIGGIVASNGGVTGLTGSGLVLQNNGGDDLDIDDNGDFTFDTQVAAGSGYAVTVKTQPSNPA